jgi:hypothetical protein
MLKWNKIEQMFVNLQEERKMTAIENEVFNLIHNDENPEEAFKIALDLLFERLDELGAFPNTVAAPRQEAS